MAVSPLLLVFGILMVAYFILYFGGRHYLETFAPPPLNQQRMDRERQEHAAALEEKPYPLFSAGPIDSVDDYETTAVFQNEGTKEATKKQINDAMTRYPLDWSVQGPNSQAFQEGEAAYLRDSRDPTRRTEGFENPSTASGSTPFDATTHKLPDADQQEAEERKLLQTYEPKSSKGLLEYSVDDVKALVDRVYTKKGLVPTLEKSKQGQNVWEIVDVQEKNPQIVWEDDGNAGSQARTMRGEEVITVPYPASDLAAGLDPFFQAKASSRNGTSSYTDWTPGLERMFAPTYPVKSWF